MVAHTKTTPTSKTIFWGSSFSSPVFVEVFPLVLNSSSSHPPSLSNFGCKHFLHGLTRLAGFSINNQKQETVLVEWDASLTSTTNGLEVGYLFQTNKPRKRAVVPLHSRAFPIFYLPSDDPTVLELQPCCIRAYAHARRQSAQSTSKVVVSNACLVRVLPPTVAHSCSFNAQLNKWDANTTEGTPTWYLQQHFLDSLQSEFGVDVLAEDFQAEVERNHNKETIQQLTIRFSLLLSKSITVSTTADAVWLRREQEAQRDMMRHSIQAHCEHMRLPLKTSVVKPDVSKKEQSRGAHPLQWEPALIIHSPNHADGKTLLAQAIAKRVGCSKIHVIRPGPLLAKYGISTDAALESLLHSLVVSAAVKDDRICIILDHLDAMMPPRLSARSSSGDSAAPVFNAISSYLRKLTGSLKTGQEWPFPIKNPLYNIASSGGRTLQVRVCIVGIVTCPNDGWKSLQRDAGRSSTILNSLFGGKYRIQPLTAATRLQAFSGAFQDRKIRLDASATARLPIAAASAAWAKGGAFCRIASHIDAIISSRSADEEKVATTKELELAMSKVKADSADFAQVSFQANDDGRISTQESGDSFFESVGGNITAKHALEDALALDPYKRKMLARFHLTPPAGIMLYGPPGCGKTLLAKAVARLLKAPSRNNSALALGGTFISLSSSDIVRAEIGTSEKLVVSAFEFADKNAPSVIFLDEFQALFTERSRGGSSKLASTLLGCLDDIRRWQNVDDFVAVPGNERKPSPEESRAIGSNRVLVLAATNTPWMIDSAFMRPGRFDRVVHVGLPTITERESILLVHLRRMKISGGQTTINKLCASLANMTSGFSGADLAALCRGAAIRTLMDAASEIEDSHFYQALKHDVRPSSDENLVRRLLAWRP